DRLEEPRVVDRVQLEVADRVAHRRRVADLPGDVEDQVGVGHHVGDGRVTDAGGQHLDVGEPIEVAGIAPVILHERVDNADRRAVGDEPVHQVGTDEATSAGHHAGRAGDLVGVGGAVGRGHGGKLHDATVAE